MITYVLFGTTLLALGLMLPRVVTNGLQPSFVATALLSVTLGLVTPLAYSLLDGLLGSQNVVNLIVHLLLNLAFLFIGLALADSHCSPSAHSALTGHVGLSALLVISSLSVWAFVVSDMSGSGTGLAEVQRSVSVTAYGTLGRVYPAFVAIIILPALLRGARAAGRRRTLTVFSGLMVVAFGLIPVTAGLQALELIPGVNIGDLLTTPTWLAVACFLSGLLVLAGGRALQRDQRPNRQRQSVDA